MRRKQEWNNYSIMATGPNHAMQLTGSARHGGCLQTRRPTGSRRAALRL